ncbi:hypothetical protein FM106_27885 [Brachybacterium faecium]|nr:hypothetical protein FM106_27885 [Brachybacterium faecium]
MLFVKSLSLGFTRVKKESFEKVLFFENNVKKLLVIRLVV